jgi:hypothetical protein
MHFVQRVYKNCPPILSSYYDLETPPTRTCISNYDFYERFRSVPQTLSVRW